MKNWRGGVEKCLSVERQCESRSLTVRWNHGELIVKTASLPNSTCGDVIGPLEWATVGVFTLQKLANAINLS